MQSLRKERSKLNRILLGIGLLAVGILSGVLVGMRLASKPSSPAAGSASAADVGPTLESVRPETITDSVGNMFRWRIYADSLASHREPCASANALLAANKLGEKDGWGNPFEIKCVGGRVLVTSRGRDATLGTSDDVAFTLDDLLGDGQRANAGNDGAVD